MFTRVGGGQLACTRRANAICGHAEKGRRAHFSLFAVLSARPRPSHGLCACTNQYTFQHTLRDGGSEGEKKTSCGGVPCSCHCPWLEAAAAARGRRRSLTCWAGGRSGGLGGRGLHHSGGRQRAPPFIDLGRYTPETTTTSTRIAHSVVGE